MKKSFWGPGDRTLETDTVTACNCATSRPPPPQPGGTKCGKPWDEGEMGNLLLYFRKEI